MSKWDMIRLGDVCDVRDGTHDSPKYVLDGYPLVTSKNITNGYLDLSDVNYIAKKDFDEINKRSKVDVGDIIMPMIGTIGKPIIVNEIVTPFAIKNVALIKFPENTVFNRYVKHILESTLFYRYIVKQSRGGTQKFLSLHDIRSFCLPTPPFTIQQKISDILDRASVLIEKRKEQMKKLDVLVKSRFVEMFGDPVTNPMGWDICKTGDVAEAIDPQPSHRTPPVSDDGIPYVGITECDYTTLKIDFDKARKVGRDVLEEHCIRYTIDEGDFIIGKIGTIGKPFFIPTERTYTLSANTVLLKPMKEKIIPVYMLKLFQSDFVENQISSERKATSQPALGIQKVRNINVPLPPLELQNCFADFVRQADKSKFKMQKGLDLMEKNYKSLMQKCFNGEIPG